MMTFVKTLHLLALVLALGGGIARLVLAGTMLGNPDIRPVLGPLVARFTGLIHAGLIGLWATGLWLYFGKYAGQSLNGAFHAKMAAVLLLSGIALTAWNRARQGRAFPLPVARRLGQVMVASAVVAMFCASIAFG